MIKSCVNSLANFYNYYAGNQASSAVEKPKDQAQKSVENSDLTRDLTLRVCFISQFNPKVEIDTKMWAVTLIVDKSIFHARLIIEGLEPNFGPFFRIADLKRPCIDTNLKTIPHCCFFSIKFGTVYLSKQKKPPLKLTECTGKADTWLRPREKVELMIAKIREEVPPNPEEDKKEEKTLKTKQAIPFSIFGRRSMFAKEIEFFEIENPELLNMRDKEPVRFAKLYALYEDSKKYEMCFKKGSTAINRRLWWLTWNRIPALFLESFSLKVTNTHPTHSSASFLRHKYLALFWKLMIIKSVDKPEKYLASRIHKSVFDTLYNNDYTWACSFLWLFPVGLCCELIDGHRITRDHEKYDENREWLNLIGKNVRKITKIQDNCYTWACEKLKIIDVEVPDYPTDRWIAISTLAANQTILSFDLTPESLQEANH